MTKWQSFLNGDPLPWLLEPENPAVRYWTLRDVLGCAQDHPMVLAARAAIMEDSLVKELLARQQPGGFWGEDETRPYTAEGTVTVLGLLHTLGVTPDARTTAGCDSLLRFAQHASGGLSMTKTLRSGIFPCTTGAMLPFLVYFGFGGDPRVRAAFAFLLEDLAPPAALDCGRYAHRPCLWGAIAGLNGLAVLPDDLRSAASQAVVKRLADALLGAPYDFAGEHKRWLTFGVPRAWDLLSALKVLAQHGYASDPRFTPLLTLLLAQGDQGGRWLCGSVSRTWPLEKRNRPSKWVTLDVLRVLAQAA
jgi:hypothetical protein